MDRVCVSVACWAVGVVRLGFHCNTSVFVFDVLDFAKPAGTMPYRSDAAWALPLSMAGLHTVC
jgi:hypothetical protein